MSDKSSSLKSLPRAIKMFDAFLRTLTEPLFAHAGLESRRKIQLIASFLLILGVFLVVSLIFVSPSGRKYLTVLLLIDIFLYWLGRSKWYKVAIYISLVLLSAYQFWITLSSEVFPKSNTDGLIVRLVLVFILGISLISLQENLILIGINLTAILSLPLLSPNISFQNIFSAFGFLIACAGIMVVNIRHRELTERDRRKEILREKIFSDEIINGLPGIFFMCSPDGKLIRWNKKLEEITDFTADELSNQLSLASLIKADNHFSIDQTMEEVCSSGKAKAEILLVAKSKHETPFYITLMGHTLDGGDYILGFGIDSTDFKRAEEARRAVVEFSLQGLAIYQNGVLVFLNPAYAQTLGYSLEELYAMQAEEVLGLVFVEDRHLFQVRMDAAIRRKEFIPRYEMRVICKSGAIRWLDVTMSAIDYQDGTALQMASVDITDRKLMEVEQARLIWELETKNAELERFTYTVSHDLKSPLITIRGFLDFLEKDIQANKTARIKADIQRILEATEKMQGLLNDLLMLSRIGHVINPPETVAFHLIAKDAVERVGGQIRTKGIQLRLNTPLPNVYVDRERIVEALQNLLDNAAKFTGNQSSPRIEIGVKGFDEHNTPIFFVQDNGIGIESQFHERIFGLFNKLNPDSEGTGIGLALVKRTIETHNGRIWLESKPGEGTTFFFTLPGAPH